MKTLSIITCFSYTGNYKYFFNPDYLKSDLKRILSFSLDQTGCSLEDIYVITDMKPDLQIRNEIIQEFKEEVIDYLKQIGYDVANIESFEKNPVRWLEKICGMLTSSKSKYTLFDSVISNLLPILRTSNVVEFSSLFVNFVQISGKDHYDRTIRKIFRTTHPKTSNQSSLLKYYCSKNLFFYYTGHGVRHWSDRQGVFSIKDICLVIPGLEGTSEVYSRSLLREAFRQISPNTSSFIVFDCCYSETLLELPFKISDEFGDVPDKEFLDGTMIYISSTQNDQTCGFYDGSDDCGSVFTYFLIEYMKDSKKSRKFLKLYDEVGKKINEYRNGLNKTKQDMFIQMNRPYIEKMPGWLFQNEISKLVKPDH